MTIRSSLRAASGWSWSIPLRAGMHYPAPVAKLERHPLRIRAPAPLLGQHNEEVLKGLLGVSDARYEELVERQVIGDAYLEGAT